MFCANCGSEIEELTKVCPFCGMANRRSDKYYDNLSKLVVAFQKGDTSAFDELYLQMNQYVRMQAKSVVQNDDLAEDVVQDVFLSVYKNIGSLENPMTFQAWLKRITYNRAVNAVNKESKYVQVQGASYDEEEGDDRTDFFDTQESTDTVLIPESSLESAEMSELFASFLSNLTYNQRVVLEGVYFEGKKLKEVAEENGMNESTAKTYMRRGKKALEKEITAWSEKTGQKLYSIPVGVLFYMLFRKALQGTAVTTAVPASLAAAVSEAAAHTSTGALSGGAGTETASHASTGALSGDTGVETAAHSSTSALSGDAGAEAAPHTSTSALSGSSGTEAAPHSSTGALSGSGETVSQTADNTAGGTDTISTTEPATTSSPTGSPSGKSGRKAAAGAAKAGGAGTAVKVAAVVAAVAVVGAGAGAGIAVNTIQSKTVEVSLDSYVTISYSGYDTYGTAVFEFDEDSFIEDYIDVIEIKDRYLDEAEESIGSDITSYKAVQLFLDDCVSGNLDMDNGLSNGDVITFVWDCDTDAAEKNYGVSLSFSDISITVSGLVEITEFDPFEGIEISYSGIEPDGAAKVSVTGTDAVYGELTYSIDNASGLSNGDTVTVTVDAPDNDYMRENYGVYIDSYSVEYTVEGLEYYLTSLSQVTDEMLEEMKQEYIDWWLDKNSDKADETHPEYEYGESYFEYVGAYFFTADSETAEEKNYITLVFQNTVRIYCDEHGIDDTTVYYCFGTFSGLTLKDDGTASFTRNTDLPSSEVSFTRTYTDPDHSFWATDINVSFSGVETMDELYDAIVADLIDSYSYETSISGQDVREDAAEE